MAQMSTIRIAEGVPAGGRVSTSVRERPVLERGGHCSGTAVQLFTNATPEVGPLRVPTAVVLIE